MSECVEFHSNDGGTQCYMCLFAQRDRLRAEVERLKGEVKHISVLYGHHSTVAGALKAQEALRAEVTAYERRIPELCKDYIAKLDAWKRYHALLSEELESAVGMAYVHGWRSTPEKIEAGKKLRAELGLPDNALDAILKERETEKPKCEVCHGAGRPECAGSSGCYCGCHAEKPYDATPLLQKFCEHGWDRTGIDAICKYCKIAAMEVLKRNDLGLDPATYLAAKAEQAEGKRVPIEEVIRNSKKPEVCTCGRKPEEVFYAHLFGCPLYAYLVIRYSDSSSCIGGPGFIAPEHKLEIKSTEAQYYDLSPQDDGAAGIRPDKPLGEGPTDRKCCTEAYARGYEVGKNHGVAEKKILPPYLACGCLIIQTSEGQMGDHRDGCALKPFSDSEVKARMVLIEGGKCADCGEIVHLGLCVGGSRNLPYPRPISDDDAKKREHECPICGKAYGPGETRTCH